MASDDEINNNKPLLEKVYYPGCPGCDHNRKKDQQIGLPIKEVLAIWMIIMCIALPIFFVYPFLYFMIRDFHIAETEEDISYYVGFVGASYMIGRALTSIFWGVVADRYGRKPVILMATSTVVIFNTLFGFSVNYPMAIATRFLLGFLNGVLGPVKAYAGELVREEHQAIALSAIGTSLGIGLIIGPALGGYLAQPADKFPSLVSQDSLFGRFPYLLPSLCISVFAVLVTISFGLWFPETLHFHKKEDQLESANEETKKESRLSAFMNLFKNWPLMSSIIVYCIFSLHDVAYTEIFSLWAVSPKDLGGLGFSTQDVGTVLSIAGASLLLFQSWFYPIMERIFGAVMVSRICGVISIPILQSYPIIALLSGFMLTFTLNCASILKNVLSLCIITGTFILQNKAVDQNQRGTANGLASTMQSISIAIGPACGGVLFSWTQKRQTASFLPGPQMIFFLLNVVEAIGVLLTFKPFLATHD